LVLARNPFGKMDPHKEDPMCRWRIGVISPPADDAGFLCFERTWWPLWIVPPGKKVVGVEWKTTLIRALNLPNVLALPPLFSDCP